MEGYSVFAENYAYLPVFEFMIMNLDHEELMK